MLSKFVETKKNMPISFIWGRNASGFSRAQYHHVQVDIYSIALSYVCSPYIITLNS